MVPQNQELNAGMQLEVLAGVAKIHMAFEQRDYFVDMLRSLWRTWCNLYDIQATKIFGSTNCTKQRLLGGHTWGFHAVDSR